VETRGEPHVVKMILKLEWLWR